MLQLVKYDRRFLEKSWEWLNDPEIKTLTLTPDFTKEDQVNFYKTLSDRKNYWIRGLLEDDLPIGVMGLKNINTSERLAEYWGYIGEKEYWGKGIGKFLINQAFSKAKELKLTKLYLKVSHENIRAKNLYLKMGFQILSSDKVEKYMIAL